jgi:hypothetical protein
MIGRAHHPPTNIVVPVVGVVVVTSGARQILCGIVPGAATQSPRLYSGSSPPGQSQVLAKSKRQKENSNNKAVIP